MPETDRTLGEHGARLDAVERDIAEIKSDVKKILAQVNEARGGWRLMMTLGSASAAVGAILATYLPKLFGK